MIRVDGCARCGQNHDAVKFAPFTVRPEGLTHFGNCPTLNEPILMNQVSETPEPVEGTETPEKTEGV